MSSWISLRVNKTNRTFFCAMSAEVIYYSGGICLFNKWHQTESESGQEPVGGSGRRRQRPTEPVHICLGTLRDKFQLNNKLRHSPINFTSTDTAQSSLWTNAATCRRIVLAAPIGLLLQWFVCFYVPHCVVVKRNYWKNILAEFSFQIVDFYSFNR